MPVFLLPTEIVFPPPQLSTKEGLLAIGGDLNPDRLIEAYRRGIFPWYSEDDPILWWSPDPRLILSPNELKISRSLAKELRRRRFHITIDTCFDSVIAACAQIRRNNSEGTWINPDMEEAYIRLHQRGYAHSIEVWFNDNLVGGLYGVSLGGCFFGESMFSTISNASKTALVYLCRFMRAHDFELIDCQIQTPHLKSLGARAIPRENFLSALKMALRKPSLQGRWSLPTGLSSS